MLLIDGMSINFDNTDFICQVDVLDQLIPGVHCNQTLDSPTTLIRGAAGFSIIGMA